MRLGKREKEFLKELQKAGGEAYLYGLAPKLYYLKSLKYIYSYLNRIATRLEQKGFIKNIYKGKRNKHYVKLIKSYNNK